METKKMELTPKEMELIQNKRSEDEAKRLEEIEEKKKVIDNAKARQLEKFNGRLDFIEKQNEAIKYFYSRLNSKNYKYWEIKSEDSTVTQEGHYNQNWGDKYNEAYELVQKYNKINKENGTRFGWSPSDFNSKKDTYNDTHFIQPTDEEMAIISEWYGDYASGKRFELPKLEKVVQKYSLVWKEKISIRKGLRNGLHRYTELEDEEKEITPVEITIEHKEVRYRDTMVMNPDLSCDLPNYSYSCGSEVFSYGRRYTNLNTITDKVLQSVEDYKDMVAHYEHNKKRESYTLSVLNALHPDAKRIDEDGDVYLKNGVKLSYGMLTEGQEAKIYDISKIRFPNTDDESVVDAILNLAINYKNK